MPETAPGNRARIIQAFPGMTVDRVPNRILEETVAKVRALDVFVQYLVVYICILHLGVPRN